MTTDPIRLFFTGTLGRLRQSARHWRTLVLLALTVVFVAVWQVPPHHAFEGVASYLPLHSFLETVSIVISFLVFGVAWNAWSRERASNTSVLACAFFAVGAVDFLHMLSFKGMPVFITPGDPEKAINFWLAARALAAAGLLAVALRPWTPHDSPRTRWVLFVAALAVVFVVGGVGLFYQHELPHTFTEGEGLTPLKIGAEYILVVLFAASAAMFYVRSRRPQTFATRDLFVAAAVSVLSELSFTLYSDVTDVFNLLGHVYKVVAYGFIYHAVFVDCVREPFRRMQQAEINARTALEVRDRLASIVDATTDFVGFADATEQMQYVNPAGKRLLGMDEKQPGEARRISDYFPAEVYARFQREILPAARRAGAWSGEAALRHRAGYDIPVSLVLMVHQDTAGGVEHTSAIARDIRQRLLAEQALRERSEILERIFDSTHFSVVYLDRNFNFIRVNRAYAKACGYPPEYFPGKNHFQMYPSTELEGIFRHVMQTGELFTVQARPFEFPDHPEWGVTYWDWTLHPLKATDGSVEALLFVLLDVTEHVRARQAVEESEEKFRHISTAAQDAIIMLDVEGKLVYWNPAAERIFGYSAAEVQGRDMRTLLAPARYQSDFRRGWEQFQVSGTGPVVGKLLQLEGLRRDGSEFPVELSVSAIKLKGRWHAVGILRDITERISAERRLREGLEHAVEAIATTIEMRDPYTAGHERRVLMLAVAIAREMGLAREKVEGLRFAALIHDIGKIRIPAEILSKPSKLDPIEFELIKTHPQVGYDILKGIQFPWPVARMVLEHHERLDGSGYPRGLKGEQILPESKILAVADVVEAISSHRPYRAALGIDAALSEIATHRGTRYDADVVDACTRLFKEKGFTLNHP